MVKARQSPVTKPYYRCLSCPQFRTSCPGLPTRDMNQQEWCEYIRDVKDTFHLTSAYIAKEADVSVKTVEKIVAINCDQDIMRSTARRIEIAVIGCVSATGCPMEHNKERIAQLMEEVKYWKAENDRKAKIIDKYLADT